MYGVNPQGCDVTPLRAPSSEELEFTPTYGEAQKCIPARGKIGIISTGSYYEEVLWCASIRLF